VCRKGTRGSVIGRWCRLFTFSEIFPVPARHCVGATSVNRILNIEEESRRMQRVIPTTLGLAALAFVLNCPSGVKADPMRVGDAFSVRQSLVREANATRSFLDLSALGSQLDGDILGFDRRGDSPGYATATLSTERLLSDRVGAGKTLKIATPGQNVIAAIPEPTTMCLLGSGLVIIAAALRRRSRSRKSKLVVTKPIGE
jgi:PEP-CTERM motif